MTKVDERTDYRRWFLSYTEITNLVLERIVRWEEQDQAHRAYAAHIQWEAGKTS